MEKIVNEIYSQCEEKLDSSQIERLISELESLMETKAIDEERRERAINPYYDDDRDPYRVVERENCAALDS